MSDSNREQTHADLLMRVAVGDLGADDPRVVAIAATDSAFAESLAELRETQALLDDAAGAERGWVDLAADTDPAADFEPLVASTLAGLAEGQVVQPDHRKGWWGWLVAAAVLAVLVVGWRVIAEPEPDDDRVLGPFQLELLDPIVGDEPSVVLRWRAAPGLLAEAAIVDSSAPPGRRILLEHTSRTTKDIATWTLDREALDQLHPGCQWRVDVGDGTTSEGLSAALPDW